MSENSSPELQYLEPKVDVEHRDDGNLVLSSPHPLGQGVAQLGLYLRHWAEAAPDRTFLAERNTDPNGGAWRKVSFGAARSQADAISKALLDRDLGPERIP